MERNLQTIARARMDDPLSSWPDHSRGHRITLLGARLFDYDCLRCWLECVATEKLTTSNSSQERKSPT